MSESRAIRKRIALISAYGEEGNVERLEVSIINPDKKVEAFKAWDNDRMRELDQVTNEAIRFAKEHAVDEIQMLDEVLPIKPEST
jgi:hypothetical protein